MEAAIDGFSATMSTVTGAMLDCLGQPQLLYYLHTVWEGVQEKFTAQI